MTQVRYHLLIPHPSAARVLLQADGADWRLPRTQGQVHYSDAAELIRGFVERTLGMQTTVLRWSTYRYDPQADRFDFWYALENHSGPHLAPGCRWAGAGDLDRLSLADPEDRLPIRAWLDERAHPAPHPLRAPWAIPGWFTQVQAWIAAQMAHLGWPSPGRIEQVKVWQRSYVLRVAAGKEFLYFKAVPPCFRIELDMLLELARLGPSAPHLPYLAYGRLALAADADRGWLLMRDLGGPALWDVPVLARWEAALRDYTRLQIDLLPHVEALRALGCRVRPVERLPEFTADLVAHGACMQPGVPGALSDGERAHLHRILPAVEDDCRRLAAFGLPLALEHGDLNPKNVIADKSETLFFDWSDCSLSHPFFSLRPLLGFVERTGADPVLARARLRDAYLGEWAAFGAPADLIAAFELADRLAPLHMALTFHLQVLPYLEDASEWVGTEGLFLRWLLAAYEAESR